MSNEEIFFTQNSLEIANLNYKTQIMKIVVAIDFSENSEKALEFAVALAVKKHAEIHLIHVIEAVFDFASQASVALASMHQDSEKLMDQLLKQFKDKSIVFHSYIKEGTASISVSRLAKELNANLIVIGTQGTSGINIALMGSTTINMIRESTVPVLVVPQQSNPYHIQKVAIAMEFADDEENFVDWAIDMSERWESGVEFVHVQTSFEANTDDKIKQLADYLEKAHPGLPVKIHTFYAPTPAEGIDQFLEENENVILIMSHHHKNVWDQILNRSQTVQMIFHSRVPILVMP